MLHYLQTLIFITQNLFLLNWFILVDFLQQNPN